jgi:hypothetical protein
VGSRRSVWWVPSFCNLPRILTRSLTPRPRTVFKAPGYVAVHPARSWGVVHPRPDHFPSLAVGSGPLPGPGWILSSSCMTFGDHCCFVSGKLRLFCVLEETLAMRWVGRVGAFVSHGRWFSRLFSAPVPDVHAWFLSLKRNGWQILSLLELLISSG